MEDLAVKGIVSDGKNAIWNSSSALFGPDGEEPDKFEIGSIPK